MVSKSEARVPVMIMDVLDALVGATLLRITRKYAIRTSEECVVIVLILVANQ